MCVYSSFEVLLLRHLTENNPSTSVLFISTVSVFISFEQVANVPHLLQRPAAARVQQQRKAEGETAESHYLCQRLWYALSRPALPRPGPGHTAFGLLPTIRRPLPPFALLPATDRQSDQRKSGRGRVLQFLILLCLPHTHPFPNTLIHLNVTLPHLLFLYREDHLHYYLLQVLAHLFRK